MEDWWEIGAPGFEPGTSCSQSRRATGLRHTPCVAPLEPNCWTLPSESDG
jgi:hypothetical protein